VEPVYRGIDYLLTGLPEKEALGLNVIEAQACGTPVIAPAAPPFTETIVDGVTGFFYRDPREDGGEDFGRLLERLRALPARPDPRQATAHLEKFSFKSFVDRLNPVVEWARQECGA
jgi:glycosyltransferase involved in cell wall biosynthesis